MEVDLSKIKDDPIASTMFRSMVPHLEQSEIEKLSEIVEPSSVQPSIQEVVASVTDKSVANKPASDIEVRRTSRVDVVDTHFTEGDVDYIINELVKLRGKDYSEFNRSDIKNRLTDGLKEVNGKVLVVHIVNNSFDRKSETISVEISGKKLYSESRTRSDEIENQNTDDRSNVVSRPVSTNFRGKSISELIDRRVRGVDSSKLIDSIVNYI